MNGQGNHLSNDTNLKHAGDRVLGTALRKAAQAGEQVQRPGRKL